MLHPGRGAPAGWRIAAAALSEWFTELEAGRIQQYQARFGVLADKPVTVDEIDDYEAMPADVFEHLWQQARSYLGDEEAGWSGQPGATS